MPEKIREPIKIKSLGEMLREDERARNLVLLNKTEQDKLQDEFMAFWDEYKDKVGLGNYSDEVMRFWLKKLAEQREVPMGYSQWVAYGKKFGYHDYYKDGVRMAIDREKKIHKIGSHGAVVREVRRGKKIIRVCCECKKEVK